jgi:hypothetical protein
VCGLIERGYTVPQIAEQLQGDPRVSKYQIEKAVWDVIARQCGPTIEPDLGHFL